jgi:hypothetical protein
MYLHCIESDITVLVMFVGDLNNIIKEDVSDISYIHDVHNMIL